MKQSKPSRYHLQPYFPQPNVNDEQNSEILKTMLRSEAMTLKNLAEQANDGAWWKKVLRNDTEWIVNDLLDSAKEIESIANDVTKYNFKIVGKLLREMQKTHIIQEHPMIMDLGIKNHQHTGGGSSGVRKHEPAKRKFAQMVAKWDRDKMPQCEFIPYARTQLDLEGLEAPKQDRTLRNWLTKIENLGR